MVCCGILVLVKEARRFKEVQEGSRNPGQGAVNEDYYKCRKDALAQLLVYELPLDVAFSE
jgi:hypothetical protein